MLMHVVYSDGLAKLTTEHSDVWSSDCLYKFSDKVLCVNQTVNLNVRMNRLYSVCLVQFRTELVVPIGFSYFQCRKCSFNCRTYKSFSTLQVLKL